MALEEEYFGRLRMSAKLDLYSAPERAARRVCRYLRLVRAPQIDGLRKHIASKSPTHRIALFLERRELRNYALTTPSEDVPSLQDFIFNFPNAASTATDLNYYLITSVRTNI